MMHKLVAVGSSALCLILVTTSVAAHHAFAAEFDAKQPVTMKGTITSVEWVNPHVWLHVDVKMPNGKTEAWAI